MWNSEYGSFQDLIIVKILINSKDYLIIRILNGNKVTVTNILTINHVEDKRNQNIRYTKWRDFLKW